ncbi:MAG: hypothetical protein E7330_03965 [Clostridiales bacterium]|nr:hypothetical protein [Clostridiales bacterium]
MPFFKEAKTRAALSALLTALVGLLFILFPGVSAKLVVYTFAALIALIGAVMLLRHFTAHLLSFFPAQLFGGLALLGAALVLFLKAEAAASLLPAILGALILISGVVKLAHAFSLKRSGGGGFLPLLIMGILGIAFGVLMLANPFAVVKTAMVLIGAGLLYSGLSDLAAVFFLAKRMKDTVQ